MGLLVGIFFLSFVVVKKRPPSKIQPPQSRQRCVAVFAALDGFFFFARFSTFVDGKRFLPPPGIPTHVRRFLTDDLPAAALQSPFGLQNTQCLGGKRAQDVMTSGTAPQD